ncbi:unnamed protein product, partial [Mycena citricolor]
QSYRFFCFVTELQCKAKHGDILCKGHLQMIFSNSHLSQPPCAFDWDCTQGKMFLHSVK